MKNITEKKNHEKYNRKKNHEKYNRKKPRFFKHMIYLQIQYIQS